MLLVARQCEGPLGGGPLGGLLGGRSYVALGGGVMLRWDQVE